jgi:glutathione synthase/RimK-type ligase-like ATP-grasp enzyme
MHVIVIDRKIQLPLPYRNWTIVRDRDFITKPEEFPPRADKVKVINLCADYSYLGYGYYCSLLAEARKQRVIPSVRTLLELRDRSLYRHALPELDEVLRQRMKKIASPTLSRFALDVYFGRADDERFAEFGRRVFDRFRCPILRVEIAAEGRWHINRIRPLSFGELSLDQQERFHGALDEYASAIWRLPKTAMVPKYTLAVLHDPNEEMPPSSPRTLQKLMRVGEQMGVKVELVERKDYAELAEYDALFIRETTAIDHHTFRFARKAESEGMPVIDDPDSILRCCNKVFLAELCMANRIPIPRTLIIDRGTVDSVEREIGYPAVLKIPDGSFSRGVVKVENREQLRQRSAALLKESDVIIAQQYIYTPFDWRVGVLRGEPLYVCQYMMSRGHWQIVKHGTDGRVEEGSANTVAVQDAPQNVVALAVRVANLVGEGFYGVDIKETSDGLYVMEVNDNPSIDTGYEDRVLKDELYRRIIQEFIRRLEDRPLVPAPAKPAPVMALEPAAKNAAVTAPASAPQPEPSVARERAERAELGAEARDGRN